MEGLFLIAEESSKIKGPDKLLWYAITVATTTIATAATTDQRCSAKWSTAELSIARLKFNGSRSQAIHVTRREIRSRSRAVWS